MRIIKSSSSSGFRITAKTWKELIDTLEDYGYFVDSAYRRSPDDHIIAYHDGRTWKSGREVTIEVTQYSDGEYEVLESNIHHTSTMSDSDECDKITAAYRNDGLIDDEGYWFFTTHGVQPGSIPKHANVLDIKDTPNGSYVKLDRFLTTDELRNYDMKEQSPEDTVTSSKEIEESGWIELASKQVIDSDGFYTDYTMYTNDEGDKFICMFGDKDMYEPDEAYADWEGDSEAEAYEWFNSYKGFDDEEDY